MVCVFQHITSYVASQVWSFKSYLRDLTLTDPNSASQQLIHLLIGADLYGSLLLGNLRQNSLSDISTVQKTALDWIISDPTGIDPCNADKVQVSLCISKCDTNSLLRKFLEDEEIPQKLFLKEEDEQ